MRTLLIAALAAGFGLALPGALAAQDEAPIHVSSSQQPDPRQLPRDVADEVIRFFNAPGTLRFSGVSRIPAARGVDGDVAVLGGPVTIAGRISGSLYVINGDLTLEQGAVIGGDILVVGGTIEGESRAAVAGEVRAYRDILRYRRTGDELAYAPQREGLSRWQRRRSEESTVRFVLALGGTYNRVEGVPIVFGPRLNLRLSEGTRLLGDARLIVRTGESFSLDDGRYGYRVRGEYQIGSRTANVGFGARAYDQVSSVETWPLRDFEAGWASFLMHDDYRDWYRRRGYAGFVALRPAPAWSLTLEARQEDVFSEDTNGVWTLFNSSEAWRDNPRMDDGLYRAFTTTLRLDTRNDRSYPSSGVMMSAEFEAGEHTGPPVACGVPPCPAGDFDYQRAWVDTRAYMRLSRAGRLGLRVAGGGKVGGSYLPMHHRVSLGFPDPLPGYSFREMSCGGSAQPGQPALCERAAVAQLELRTHLGFDFGPDWANDWGDDGDDERWEPFHVSGPDIVMFADAGYAWSVGTGTGQIPSDRMPSLSLFQPDLGIGLDLGPVGAYLAKSIGPVHRPVTFTVRLGRRF